MALKHLLLICLVSIVTMSMVISPSFSYVTGSNDFNSTSPLYNATITLNPNSPDISQISWGFSSNTINATYVRVASSIQVDGVVSSSLATLNRTYSNTTNGSPQVTQSYGSIDPCVTGSVNNQTIAFVVSEATTDAPSGTLAQYLNVWGLPIVATNNSVTVSQVSSCFTFNNSNNMPFCSTNAFFGLNITNGQNKNNNKDNYTIILEIELDGNAKINQKINFAVVTGDGNCYSSYNKNDVGKSYFKFDLSNADDDDTTLQFTIVPKTNTALWYLYLDYSGSFTSTQDTGVTVSLTVQSTPDDGSSSGSHDDESSSGSHDDDDSHKGRKIAGAIIAIVVGILVIAAIAVVIIRRRRAHFEALE